MRAVVLDEPGQPLRVGDVPEPRPGPGQVVMEVGACGVCRTDLHLLDGELPEPRKPVIPGHQIVGRVVERGEGVDRLREGDRIGVPWLGWTCGECDFCARGEENLCDRARFTGHTLDGGFAEYAAADARFCFPIADAYSDVEAAPLLCAGLIGYRTLRMAGPREHNQRVGIYGFGAAAHLLAQVLTHQGREVYAFTRPGDEEGQRFARRMGATWAGGSDQTPPVRLDAALLFAPVGALVPAALRHLRKGGQVVSGGIHMSDIPSFPYSLLWGERVVRSVANLTREDGAEFLALAPKVPVRTETTVYPLAGAAEALEDLRHGRFRGSAVLVPRASPSNLRSPRPTR
ncbi:MAG: zinc-dependent alcohol dehydrogenase family protein [Myxococcota bacterium]